MVTPSPARPKIAVDSSGDMPIPNYFRLPPQALPKQPSGVDHISQGIRKLFSQSPTLRSLLKQLDPTEFNLPDLLVTADFDYQRAAVQSWRAGPYPPASPKDWGQVRISHQSLLQEGAVNSHQDTARHSYRIGVPFANPEGAAHHIALQLQGLDAHRERKFQLNRLRQQFEANAVLGKPYDITADLDSMRKSADMDRAKAYVQAWNAAVDVGMRNKTFSNPAIFTEKIPEGALYRRQNPDGLGQHNILEPSIEFIKGVVSRGWLTQAPKPSDFYLKDDAISQLAVFARNQNTDHKSYAETLLALATAKSVTQVFTVDAKALGLTAADLKASGLPQAFLFGFILKDARTGQVLLQSNGLNKPPQAIKPDFGRLGSSSWAQLAQSEPALHQLLVAAQLPGDKAMDAALGQLHQAAGHSLTRLALTEAGAVSVAPEQTAHAMTR